jgi:hypothetical protein
LLSLSLACLLFALFVILSWGVELVSHENPPSVLHVL